MKFKEIVQKRILLVILIMLIVLSLVVRLIVSENTNSLNLETMRRGLAAKHIINNDSYSIYSYAGVYEGGNILEYYIAIPIILLSNISNVYLVPIIISIFILVMAYIFTRRFFNQKVAIITSLLLIMPTKFYWESNLFYYSNHLDGILFSFIILFIFYEIMYNNKMNSKYSVYFGLVSGFSYWIFPTTLVMVLTCLFFLYIFNKKFFISKNFFLFILSFFIGFFPRIYYYLKPAPYHLHFEKYFLGEISSNLQHFFPAAKRLFIELIPHSLFDSEHLVLAYSYYFIALIAFIAIFYLNRKSILNLLKGLIPSEKFNIKPKEISKETFILIYPVIFLAIFCFMREGLTSPPHRLISIHPFIFIIISIFLVWLWNKKFKVISLLIILFLVSTGVYGNLILIRGADQELETTKSINNLISFLDNKNIKYVYSDSFIPLALIFVSNEKIIAYLESFGDVNPEFRYPKYNQLVNNATKYAFVYYENSSINKIFDSYLNAFNISYQKQRIADKVIYYSLSKNIRPENFSTNYIFIKDSIGDQFFKNRLTNNYISYKRLDFDGNKVIYFLIGVM